MHSLPYRTDILIELRYQVSSLPSGAPFIMCVLASFTRIPSSLVLAPQQGCEGERRGRDARTDEPKLPNEKSLVPRCHSYATSVTYDNLR